MTVLSVDHFASLQGDRFVLHADDAGQVSTELVEARMLSGPAFEGRQPFALLFRGPATPVLPQRMYRLDHPQLPMLEIFLVPVAADAEGVRYEAVFG